jgi:hypothetical protein
MGNTLTVEAAKAMGKKKDKASKTTKANRTAQTDLESINEINEDEIYRDPKAQHKPCIPSEKSAFRNVSGKKNFRFHRKKVYGNVATEERND